MRSRTVHVIPAKTKGRWVVKRSGTSVPGSFASRDEATSAAKRLIQGNAGQVVVLTRGGAIISAVTHGLPKVQSVRARGRIDAKTIEKAVSAVVKARLSSE